jgi:hypothetical protein
MNRERFVNADISLAVAPIRPISPALKSWIEKCIVPILVREYLATQQIDVVTEYDEVLESDATSVTAAKEGQ